jgi:hypothetical protein
MFGYALLIIFFHVPSSLTYALIFLLTTYLIDIDPVVSLFTTCRKIPEAQLIVETLREKKFKKAAELATIHHKKLNRHLGHNIIGLIVVLAGFIFFSVVKNYLWVFFFGGILTHFLFDIFDDIKQLGHFRNWLWILTPSER